MKKIVSLGVVLAGFVAWGGVGYAASSPTPTTNQEVQAQSSGSQDEATTDSDAMPSDTKGSESDKNNKKTRNPCGAQNIGCTDILSTGF